MTILFFAANDNALQHRTNTAYDTAGRLVSETSLAAGGPALTTAYQYDKTDNRTRITWPDNFYAAYEYDANSRLENIKQNGAALLAHYDYDAQSRLAAIRYGPDSAAPISSIAFAWQADSDLDSLTHSFANDAGVQFDYDYDGAGKLISEAASAPGWLYDPSDSRTDTYSPANVLNQYPSIGSDTLSYDGNGNLETGRGGASYVHNSDNQLTSAVVGRGAGIVQI